MNAESKTPLNSLGDMDFSDRRWATRACADLPAKIEFIDKRTGKLAMLHGMALNMSEHGIAVKSFSHHSLPEQVYLELILPDVDTILRGLCSVRWRKTSDNRLQTEYGLKILELTPPHVKHIHSFLSNTLIKKAAVKDRRSAGSISNESFQFINKKGRKVSGVLDIASDKLAGNFIVIPPAYGETKEESIWLAQYFTSNGFSVVRYDASNHLGESDGSMQNCTLQNMYEDLSETMDVLFSRFEVKFMGIVASRLATLVAIKTAANDSRVQFLTCISPVPDLQAALKRVYSDDLVEEFKKGKRWGTRDILGYPVNSDTFLEDAIANEYHSFSSLCNKMSSIKAPILALTAQDDLWSDFDQVKRLLSHASDDKRYLDYFSMDGREAHSIPNAPEFLKLVLSKTIKMISNHYKFNTRDTVVPDPRKIGLQYNIEKTRIRHFALARAEEAETDFWSKYLSDFRHMSTVSEYSDFFHKIMMLLGNVDPGDRILDAGCGNGSFGRWLLSLAAANKLTADFHYFGADFVSEALQYAQKMHEEAVRKINVNNIKINPNFTYNIVDLTKSLPYIDNYFDHVCCNLVLSYLPDPVRSIEELLRVSKAGRRIVITSVKPKPDFSSIYRGAVGKCRTQQELDAGRKLLDNFAGLAEREAHCKFRFFSEQELLSLVQNFKVKRSSVERSFGNQANVLMIEK